MLKLWKISYFIISYMICMEYLDKGDDIFIVIFG